MCAMSTKCVNFMFTKQKSNSLEFIWNFVGSVVLVNIDIRFFFKSISNDPLYILKITKSDCRISVLLQRLAGNELGFSKLAASLI